MGLLLLPGSLSSGMFSGLRQRGRGWMRGGKRGVGRGLGVGGLVGLGFERDDYSVLRMMKRNKKFLMHLY